MTQTNTDKTVSTIREKVREEILRSAKILRPEELALTVDDVLERALKSRTQEPAECTCDDCGGRVVFDLLVDDELWATIAPRPVEGFKGGGVLCPSCILSRALRAASITPPAPERSKEEVGQNERLNLHKKVLGMIRDKQRYAGAILDGRELHVIAEALLDRAIETEKAALEPASLHKGEAGKHSDDCGCGYCT